MEILFVFPGSAFEMLQEFMQSEEVRIGYSLNKELFSLPEIERLDFIKEVAKRRGPKNISEPALKRRIGWWNSFFDLSLKYAVIPSKGWKTFYVVKLEPTVLFDSTSEYCQVRKFKLLGIVSLEKKYQNNKGISRISSSKILGLDELINANENQNRDLRKEKSYLDEEEINGFEGEKKELITKHLRRERDRKFALKYRNKYKHIKTCPACSFNGKDKYGIDDANSILELHHIVPLKNISGNQKVLENDVSFLCPNCHRAIHKMMGHEELRTISIDEFKKRIL